MARIQIYSLTKIINCISLTLIWLLQIVVVRIQTDPTKYFNGFTNEIDPFEMWFEKLLKLDSDKIIASLDKLPNCWKVPMNYLSDTISFLFSNRNKFISEFKRAIEIKKRWKQRAN